MTVRLCTAGRVGVEMLLHHFRAMPRTYTETLHDLVHGSNRLPEIDIERYVVDLRYPYDPAELAANRLRDSAVFRDVAAVFEDWIGCHKDPRCQMVVVGREHGLAMVPMKADAQEEARRDTELMVMLTPHVEEYRIFFPGMRSVKVEPFSPDAGWI